MKALRYTLSALLFSSLVGCASTSAFMADADKRSAFINVATVIAKEVVDEKPELKIPLVILGEIFKLSSNKVDEIETKPESKPESKPQEVDVAVVETNVTAPNMMLRVHAEEELLNSSINEPELKTTSPPETTSLPIVEKPKAKVKPKPKSKPKAVSKPIEKTVVAIAPVVAIPKPEVKPAINLTQSKSALPTNALPLIETLKKAMKEIWPNMPLRSFMGSKIEQETCISLTHKRCWSPYAELKTNREYGFGLGQTTIAYKADGSERFNVWQDLRGMDSTLKQKWTWENRFDAELQIRALLVKSKISHNAIRFPVADEYEHLAFGSVTYNSGSVLMDRNICVKTPGCDPSRWFGHVEKYSTKAKIPLKGYGKSFHDISREYPRNVLIVRRPKYIPYLDN